MALVLMTKAFRKYGEMPELLWHNVEKGTEAQRELGLLESSDPRVYHLAVFPGMALRAFPSLSRKGKAWWEWGKYQHL